MKTIALVLVVVLCGAIHPAVGGGSGGVDDEARGHYERGQTLYKVARYDEALAEFSAGFELSGRPLFLFNMAECARLAGDAGHARALYERYLSADPDGELVKLARKRLAQLGPSPARPAAPTVTEKRPSPSETTRPAQPATKLPTPAEAAQLTTPPTETIPDRPEAAPARSWWRRWPIWAAVGVVVIGGSATAYALTRDDCTGCVVVDLDP